MFKIFQYIYIRNYSLFLKKYSIYYFMLSYLNSAIIYFSGKLCGLQKIRQTHEIFTFFYTLSHLGLEYVTVKHGLSVQCRYFDFSQKTGRLCYSWNTTLMYSSRRMFVTCVEIRSCLMSERIKFLEIKNTKLCSGWGKKHMISFIQLVNDNSDNFSSHFTISILTLPLYNWCSYFSLGGKIN